MEWGKNMTKKFNLSEKRRETCKEESDFRFIYLEKDVKDFIKKTEKDMRNSKLSRVGMIERFKQRAGVKLI